MSLSSTDRIAAGRYDQAGELAPSHRKATLLLLTPYTLALVFCLALPLMNVFFLSVHSYSPTTIWTPQLTFANYLEVFRPYLGRISVRTLRIGVTASVLCVLLGYPIAYHLARCSKRQLAV